MTFFADENVTIHAVRLLDAFDLQNQVRYLTQDFPPGVPDVEWIRAVAEWEEPPVVLSGDGRILRNKAERAVLRSSNLTFVYLAKGWLNTPWNDYAWKIVRAWPGVVRDTVRVRRPSIFELTVSSLKLKLIGETVAR